MPTPQVTLSQPQNPFIGESFDLKLSFDNDGGATGYGPFVVLFLDKTGTDGSGAAVDDGLTFNSASFLGSDITTTEIDLTGSSTETITVHGEDYDVSVPAGFEAGDSLVAFELPFGSFVPTQPVADIDVIVGSSDLADLGQPLNIATQSGFVLGSDPNGNGTITSSSTNTAVEPQLVTLQKEYLGPEDETATGPNFTQQYQVVVNIAPGQTITDLDVTDILPDTMQFVDVVSIVDSSGTAIAPGRINNVSTPDDGGLDSIGTPENDIGSDGVPTPGGTVTRRIDSVTGTGDRDIVMTVEFFVPRLDVNGNVIIDANNGDDIFDQNQSELGNNAGDGNNWIPNDTPRDDPAEVYISPTVNDGVADPVDPPGPETDGQTNTGLSGAGDDDSADQFNDPDKILEEQSIAIQKTVANQSSPGADFVPDTVLEYTLEFQVSDYFAFEDVSIEDIFSDGQRFDDSFKPTLSFNEHGNNDSGLEFDFSGYTQVGSSGTGGVSNSDAADFLVIDETDINNLNDTSGDTKLTFKVSDLLSSTNATTGQDNQLVGGGVPDGGFNDNGATLNNNPPLNTGLGGTTGTIKFRTIVQDTYSDNFPSGDASVDSSDRLENNATIDGAILDVDDLIANGLREADDTQAEISIATGNLYKSIYAINGDVFAGADTDAIDPINGLTGYATGVEVDPGDEVTYRLTFQLPVSDVELLQLQDFFPLPAYDVTELSSTTLANLNASSSGDLTSVPLAGFSEYGPLHDFAKDVEGLTIDAAGNSFLYNFGTFDDPDNDPATIDLLVTTTIQDDPVADGLVFTNQVNQSQQNTFEETSDRDAIVQVNLRQPDVTLTKDVVGATSNLEAGDIVTFAVTLENTGFSEKGAFDVTVTDSLPAGFKIPAAGANVQAAYGDGTTVSSSIPGFDLTFTGDLFGAGLVLDDNPVDPTKAYDDLGALESVDNADKNKVVLTYELEVAEDLSDIYTGSSSIIENTATGVYANTEGGEKFPETEDTAEVTVAKPEIFKERIATSEASTTGNDVAIGEIVRYRLIAKVPEGTANNLIIEDRLPGGLNFLDDGSSRYTFVTNSGFSNTDPAGALDLTLPAGNSFNGDDPGLVPDSIVNGAAWNSFPQTTGTGVDPNDNYPNIGSDFLLNSDADGYGTGRDVRFKFGDLTNSDRDSDDEYVVVEFNALVDNRDSSSRNDTGEPRNNSARIYTEDSNGTRVEHDRTGNVRVDIVEPNISSVTKSVNNSIGDADDTARFTVTFTNTGNATAFDINVADDLAGGDLDTLNLVSVTKNTAVLVEGAVGTGDYILLPGHDTENLDIRIHELAPTESITVTYDADIKETISPNRDNVSPVDPIINTADVTYTSLPDDGTDSTDTTNNPTGSDTPGASGTATGERDGSNVDDASTEPNDYGVSDDAEITTPGLAVDKTIVETSQPFTTGSNLAIGEIVRYRLQVELPEGQIQNLQLKDFLPTGLRYVANTGKVALVADDPAQITSDAFSASLAGNDGTVAGLDPVADIAGTVDGSGDLNFDLGTINNTDDDTSDASLSNTDNKEYAIIEFNALVENTADNDGGVTLQNNFQVTADNATTLTSSLVDVNLLEPSISIDKQVEGIDTTGASDAPNADSGDPVSFSVTFDNAVTTSNANATTAFDVVMADTLPASLSLDTGSITAVDTNGNAVGINTANSSGNTVTVNVDELPVGETITVNYEANISDSVTPEQLITNTAEVTYTSLPQDLVNAALANNTGSTNTGTSGAVDGERDGTGVSGAEPNDFTKSDDGHVVAPPLDPIKSIVGTSEASTAETDTGVDDGVNPLEPRDVTIGEVVRYRLEVGIPEGTIPNFKIQDTLPAGMRYLNDGTTAVGFLKNRVDGGGAAISSITSDNPDIVNNPEVDGAVGGDGSQPTFTLPNSGANNAISGDGGDGFDSGEAPIFDLGTLTNLDRDNDGESVVIEFNAIVENIAANQDGTIDNPATSRTELVNQFIVTSEPDGGGTTSNPATSKTSNSAVIEVLEPEIFEINKAADLVTGDAGDTIDFTISFSNTGTTTAFDVNITDDLATSDLENLSDLIVTNTTTGSVLTAGTEYTINNIGSTSEIDLTINQIAAGDEFTVTYKADITGTIGPDYTIENTANVNYGSLPGSGTPFSTLSDPTTNTTGVTSSHCWRS